MLSSKLFLCFLIILFIPAIGYSQELMEPIDSSTTLGEVTVQAFEQNRKANESAYAVHVISNTNSDRSTKISILPSFNTIGGVRMEERSPGSYRISIRGSSLRSPFGVRNVKVYWNDIPVTDAGGNTYFNQFAQNSFSGIEIVNGPTGSLYGAGTGGLIMMNSVDDKAPGLELGFVKGSFNTNNFFVTGWFGADNSRNRLSYAHNETAGYREQSAMRRDNLSWVSQLKSSDRQQLKAAVTYTSLYYQTPGGLTAAHLEADPKAARPAAGPNPGSVQAHAAIYQQTLLAGLSNQQYLTKFLDNKTVLFASSARIQNPSIRNYERRLEPGGGVRSSFIFHSSKESESWKIVLGTELQKGYFNTRVSGNVNGQPDTLQSNDDIEYSLSSYYLHTEWQPRESWTFIAGISSNITQVKFTRLSVTPLTPISRRYQNEYAPDIRIRKSFSRKLAVTAAASRGFSPPTVSELLPSTGVISTGLEAEYGWNYELRIQSVLVRNRLLVDLSLYHFGLRNALVQQRDASGADYYVNAGSTHQNGIEANASYQQQLKNSIARQLRINMALTMYDYRYANYQPGGENYNDNFLPSVPNKSLSLLADLSFRKNVYLQITYYGAGRIFLNDANSASAAPYHLLGSRIGWTKTGAGGLSLDLHAGADNLFNEIYSLGNDINAFGGRYFNTAAPRNFYSGISLSWNKPKK